MEGSYVRLGRCDTQYVLHVVEMIWVPTRIMMSKQLSHDSLLKLMSDEKFFSFWYNAMFQYSTFHRCFERAWCVLSGSPSSLCCIWDFIKCTEKHFHFANQIPLDSFLLICRYTLTELEAKVTHHLHSAFPHSSQKTCKTKINLNIYIQNTQKRI